MVSPDSAADSEGQTRLILQRRTVDTDQLPRYLWLHLQSRVDTLCQGGKVGIKRTNHNASMHGRGVMQSNEMASVERDHDPVLLAPRHRLRRFVGLDLVLDLLSVRTGIGPRIGQILGPQRGIAPQEVGFTGAQTFRLD